ncbi:hypothetical protein [Rhizobium sp. MHM7A]|uniref:hypothetical protein n=1 Tax=Rhizobium sp. MHM7A TaxID=2583233 RepID=UPI001105A26E|nr:hypothetical protein [Rhizobium sp. MHM7A]TLX16180.1 hypothetical protein FFR93_02310 [Rhizobium sp. MHM7A]
MRQFLTASAFLLLLTTTASAQSSEAVGVEFAEKAIAKGYGTTCDLSMQPSKQDGYYPCIDFGPYRYVREYQKVSAYVVGPGRAPFKIMAGSPQSPSFILGGPWEQDFAARAVMFWNDVVEGGEAKAKEQMQSSKARKDAENYVKGIIGQPEAAETKKADSPSSQPQNPDTITTEELRMRSVGPREMLDVDENDIQQILSQQKP